MSKRTLIQRTLDNALEASMLSYTTLGYKARASRFAPLEDDLSHLHVMITGANSGTGRACAETLAKRNAHVHMVCRNPERGKRAHEEVQKLGDNVHLHLCDVSLLDDCKKLCDKFINDKIKLNRLLLNAGVLLNDKSQTPEGFDSTFATNLLGGFYMTQRLASHMGEGSRILNVTSGGMYTQKLHLKVLQGHTKNYDGVVAYAQTKRGQTILTELWAERLKDRGIAVHSMHPGWANTPGVAFSLPRFHKILGGVLRSPEEGADTLSWLCATREEIGSGKLWMDREVKRTHVRAKTRSSDAEREALFALCEKLCGDFDFS